MQLQKEMDTEIPDSSVKSEATTSASSQVSLKWPLPNVSLMTPPNKKVQLKTATRSRVSAGLSDSGVGKGADASADTYSEAILGSL